jgi:hypothetical protein
MRYAIDLGRIPLDTYRELLKRQTLLPSRRLLLDAIDERFSQIQSQGVGTVAQLLAALSSPTKIEDFAGQSEVPNAYLAVLRREAGTLKQKPVPLSAFPDTDRAEIDALERQGVKTSKDYWERCPADGMLYALCDLARVNGIGPSAAAMFCAAGYRSAADIANADIGAIFKSISAVNADKRYYAGNLGEKDLRFCIDAAQVLLRFSD